MTSALALVVALLVVAPLTWLLLRVDRVAPATPASRLRALTTLCRGDRTAAARLIAFEKSRAPRISEQTAVNRAIARLERDRTR
ncbi:MAG: hypothetical protein JNM74_21860 [Myxococcales bacterium]|nr:hypothetical protein [Myxococcales bacterium]